MVEYQNLSDEERNARKLWAAKTMKALNDDERNALIDAANNVFDAREQFLFRQRQIQLAKSYRKGTNNANMDPTTA